MEREPAGTTGETPSALARSPLPRVDTGHPKTPHSPLPTPRRESAEILPDPQSEKSPEPLTPRTFLFLMADDDPEDCLLFQEAIQENGLPHRVHFVHDGEELLAYLQNRGPNTPRSPGLPDLLLLDLNMPKLDGREALRRIKSDPRLRSLPVVVLTTSTTEEDVRSCYQMGAASFLSKPISYRGWIDLVRDLCEYWFERVRLPCPEKL